MRFLLSLLFLSCLFLFAHAGGGGGPDVVYDPNGDVVVLAEDNFNKYVSEAELVMVEFFAPWCGHCKALKPEYESAAKSLKGIAPIAAVDCTKDRPLCEAHGIKGFPTIKVWKKGVSGASDYKGPRKAADIVSYMKKSLLPAWKLANTAAEVTDLKSSDDVSVLVTAFVSDDAHVTTVKTLAEQLKEDFTFVIVSDASVASELGGVIPSVTVEKVKSEPGQVLKTEDLDEEDLAKFVENSWFQAFGEIGPDNFQKYLDRGLPLVWVFVDYKDTTLTPAVEQVVKEVAQQYSGQLSFVKLDGVKWAEHGKHFGVDSKKLPGIVLEKREDQSGGFPAGNYLFSQETEVSVETLKAHIDGVKAGTVAPHIRSQEPPATQETAVFTLVGKTFKEEVLDNDKDVMVEFYAPWCGHCKQLAPKYQKLAEHFQSNDKIRIAAIDATENDVAGVNIQGFPTLYFYAAGKKDKPEPYNGDRSTEALQQFIEQHATNLAGAPKSPEGTASHDEL